VAEQRPARRMTGDEVGVYFQRVHLDAAGSGESLTPVIHPNSIRWINRFVDYAHRLGMKRAFAYPSGEWGAFAGRAVLDVGCGTGRWARKHARRGAHVTGVDISEDAIRNFRRELRGHRFIGQDLRYLDLPLQEYDLVNSVTVLQHLVPDDQGAVLTSVRCCKKEHSYLVLLENVSDIDSPHVFAHSVEGWTEIEKSAGFRPCRHWNTNYEALVHASWRLISRLTDRAADRPIGDAAATGAVSQGMTGGRLGLRSPWLRSRQSHKSGLARTLDSAGLPTP
jgi:SAM-dependent methyltransferase